MIATVDDWEPYIKDREVYVFGTSLGGALQLFMGLYLYRVRRREREKERWDASIVEGMLVTVALCCSFSSSKSLFPANPIYIRV